MAWSAPARPTASRRFYPMQSPATLDGAQHHELFTGPDFVTNVPPALRRFYLKMS